MFSYFSHFIKDVSGKIQALAKADTYPINSDAENALMENIEASAVTSIDKTLPLVVATEASSQALAATLS